MQSDRRDPSLFSQLLLFSSTIKDEIRYSTQELLVEVVARFYYMCSKTKDVGMLNKLKKVMPLPFSEMLENPSQGFSYVLRHARYGLYLFMLSWLLMSLFGKIMAENY